MFKHAKSTVEEIIPKEVQIGVNHDPETTQYDLIFVQNGLTDINSIDLCQKILNLHNT